MAIGDVHYTSLDCTEENGAITSMRAKRIFAVTPGTVASTMLNSALTQCTETRGHIPASFPNLRLSKRTAKLVDEQNSLVEVTLEYVPYTDYVSTTFIWKSGGGLRQVQRTTDYYGIPVTVTYTYPSDPASPYYYWDDENLAGATVTQGVTLSLNIPTFTMTGRGIVQTDTPLEWANRIKGRLNSDPWMGGAARSWLCQSAEFEPHDLSTSPNEYLFTVGMEYHNEGWEEYAVFTRPDGTIVPNPGPLSIKHVVQYPTADFNVPFPGSL